MRQILIFMMTVTVLTGCVSRSRFYNLYAKEIETIYIGRNKQGRGNMFLFSKDLTVKNLIIGPEVTEFTEPNDYLIKAIYSLSEEPEKVTIGFNNNFYYDGTSHNTYAETPLYVPVGMKERYMATEGWKEFQTIVELKNMPTGLSTAHATSRDASKYYNLQGQQLKSTPQKGIYIRNGKKYVAK